MLARSYRARQRRTCGLVARGGGDDSSARLGIAASVAVLLESLLPCSAGEPSRRRALSEGWVLLSGTLSQAFAGV